MQEINEHLVDSFPQMIFVIGLPASGKSSFIKNELSNYFPSLKNSRLADSDVQLNHKQKEQAKKFAKTIYHVESEREYLLIKNMYENNVNDSDIMVGREDFVITTPYSWIKSHKNLSENKFIYEFVKEFFVKDWASNFTPRPLAKAEFKELTKRKLGNTVSNNIMFNNNDVIIPILGDRISKILDFIDMAKGNYIPSIIYLDIPIEETIKRDKYRKEKEGRSVGEKLIREKASLIEMSWKDLSAGSYKRNGIYRMLHFVWLPNNTKFGEYRLRQKYINTDLIKKHLSIK